MWYKILNIVALLLIPIIVVWIGQVLQDRAKRRDDKMQIFKILMSSRVFGWTQEMVWALNIIEIVFADDKIVIKQWKKYYDKLCIEKPTETDLKKINTERNKLLECMSNSLGYKDKITWETIENPYIPNGMINAIDKNQKFQNSQMAVMDIIQQTMQGEK